MATFVIGDIHGNLSSLNDLLSKVLTEVGSEDTLVFLGDYIDRGPDSRHCVERIIEVQNESPFSVVALCGNHEDWMMRTLSDFTRHSWILGMEGWETIASYSPSAASALRIEMENAGLSLITEKREIPYGIFFETVPDKHLEFFRGLKAYWQTEDALCVHGGIDLREGTVEKQSREVLLWGPDAFPETYTGTTPIVYGHLNNPKLNGDGWPRPRIVGNTFGIDTISTGVLTAVSMPEGTVFQSKRYQYSSQSTGRSP